MKTNSKWRQPQKWRRPQKWAWPQKWGRPPRSVRGGTRTQKRRVRRKYDTSGHVTWCNLIIILTAGGAVMTHCGHKWWLVSGNRSKHSSKETHEKRCKHGRRNRRPPTAQQQEAACERLHGEKLRSLLCQEPTTSRSTAPEVTRSIVRFMANDKTLLKMKDLGFLTSHQSPNNPIKPGFSQAARTERHRKQNGR